MKVLSIIWKDTRLRFASVSELVFFLILPIAFTFVLAGGTGAPADTRIRLLVSDEAESPLSQQIIAELAKSESVQPELVTRAAGEAALKDRSAAALLVIPANCDFGALETGEITLDLVQSPNSLDAQAAGRAVEAVLYRLGSSVQIARQAVTEAERIRPFTDDAARRAYFDAALTSAKALAADAPNRLEPVLGNTTDAARYEPAAYASAGQLITWVFIPLFGISALFAEERQTGTLRRLLITPTGRGTYLLGTILGNVFWALVQMSLLVLFAIVVLKVRWADQPAALAAMLVSSTLAAAAFGVMLGAFVKTANQANGLSIMLGMVMALLGGCWYPSELFPEAVRTAVQALPTTWAMQGMTDMLLRGQGLAGVLPEASVLLGFAAFFFAIGVWRFRYE
ncbi:MAG: ABC transporter permease [Anaerolineae bacterium]|nr:ABC transporter permease [Candidatus Roseilinea sp.]MDW8449986.1 ABC transporter permease [Anaerolineae bacterium]